MNKRAILAATAIVVGSFNPVFNTAALAAVIVSTPAAAPASQETLDAMQDQCDLVAAGHDIGNGDVWTGVVVVGAVTWVSGPDEVGDHSIADAIPGTLEGAGTFTPGSVSILGDPFRIGGSVNMFGVLQSTGGHYSASEYDFEGDFTTVYAHAFTCDIYQAVNHPGDPLGGHYEIRTDLIGSPQADAILQECNAYNLNGSDIPHPGYWGNSPQGNCQFVAEPTDDVLDDPVLFGNEAGGSINQEQTDTLIAHEDAGEGFDIGETVLIGQAVICISPSKNGPKGVPGTWTKQNGYTGDKCTTAWFNVAPWGAGSQDSNGTYISVPLA